LKANKIMILQPYTCVCVCVCVYTMHVFIWLALEFKENMRHGYFNRLLY